MCIVVFRLSFLTQLSDCLETCIWVMVKAPRLKIAFFILKMHLFSAIVAVISLGVNTRPDQCKAFKFTTPLFLWKAKTPVTLHFTNEDREAWKRINRSLDWWISRKSILTYFQNTFSIILLYWPAQEKSQVFMLQNKKLIGKSFCFVLNYVSSNFKMLEMFLGNNLLLPPFEKSDVHNEGDNK